MNPRLLPSTRREFLRRGAQGVGLLAFSRFAPQFLIQSTLAGTPAPERDRRILVLVQLAGGNDGLNTVVPFADPAYHSLRPTLGLKKDATLPINDSLGLNPGCAALHALLDEGKLGIVQNVGYPNPNRSHFRSTEIWETASESSDSMSTGWIGRYLDNACAGTPPASDPEAIHVSSEVPQTFGGAVPHNTFGLANRGGGGRRDDAKLLQRLVTRPGEAAADPSGNNSFLRATMMDALVAEQKIQGLLGAYKPEAPYPGTDFAQSLRNVAALISAGLPTRVYFVSIGGFDTHANQLNSHQNLLKNLSEGLAAFQRDLTARKLDDQVLTTTFSEFGRRPNENESRGTDHGTAAPLFVMGRRIAAPLYGTAPDLRVAKNADLAFTTDFRSVYATILDKWLGAPADDLLGAKHPRLDFLGSGG
jgi:uncharacterized protein (DUF1501 family)